MIIEIFLIVALALVVAGALFLLLGRLRHRADTAINTDIMNEAYFRGLSYLVDEQYDRAIEVFVRLAEVDAETVELHFALGSLFRRKGEIERATLIHQNLIARPNLSPEHRQQAFEELGKDYLRAGLYDRAEKIFLKLLKEKAHQAFAARQLIFIYEQQHDWLQAVAMRRRLERVTGSSQNAVVAHYYCEIAEEAYRQGKTDRGDDALKQARGQHSHLPRVIMLQAERHVARGESEAALRQYRRLLRREPWMAELVLPEVSDLVNGQNASGQIDSLLQPIINDESSSMMPIAVAGLLHANLRSGLVSQAIETEFEPLIDPWTNGPEAEPETLETARKVLIGLLENWLQRRPLYQCAQCGFKAHHLYWQCPGCRTWSSFRMRTDVLPEPGLEAGHGSA